MESVVFTKSHIFVRFPQALVEILAMPRRRTARLPALALTPWLVLACPLPLGAAHPQETFEVGEWSCLLDWRTVLDGAENHPIDEIAHAALLPTGLHAGKVLLWNYQTAETATRTFLFDPLAPGCDPSALQELETALSTNFFCSGHTFLPDGSLLVAGGMPLPSAPGGSTLLVSEKVLRFSPRGLTWVPMPDMNVPRFYPTPVLLNRKPLSISGEPWETPGSSVLVLGGPALTHFPLGQPLWEILAPTLGSTWQGLFPGPSSSLPCTHPWVPPVSGPEYDLVSVLCEDTRLDSYPRGLQLSSGDVFLAGDVDTVIAQKATAAGRTWFVRPPGVEESDSWELHEGPWMGALDSTDPADRHKRFYAPAVLLHRPQLRDRVLVFGGANVEEGVVGLDVDVTDTVEELVFSGAASAPSGLWQAKAAMAASRVYHNAVVLPTGQILITGGGGPSTSGGLESPTPVYAPELYNPGTSPTDPSSTAWMATPPAYAVPGDDPPTPFAPIPRLYHHVALLLPDGRVLVAGGFDRPGFPSSKHNAEIYSPPYLHQGQRPLVHDLPSEADLASGELTPSFSVAVSLPAADVLERVVLLRPASVTHHFDADQRYIELAFDGVVTSFSQPSPPGPPIMKEMTLTVEAPSEELAPQGWYMLFVIAHKSGSDHRVPSIGQFVRFH